MAVIGLGGRGLATDLDRAPVIRSDQDSPLCTGEESRLGRADDDAGSAWAFIPALGKNLIGGQSPSLARLDDPSLRRPIQVVGSMSRVLAGARPADMVQPVWVLDVVTYRFWKA